MQLLLLSDCESEQLLGGYSPIMISTVNNIQVEPASPQLAINTRVATVSQFNNAVSVSAFGGVNSSYRAELITQQVNELYFA
jgi:hypothetical protein